MRELSLFSGAGGGLLGTKLLGFEHVGYVEYDDYCQRVIRARIDDGYLDDAPIFSDIRTFIEEGYADAYSGLVDVVTAGFPCQAFSSAARGRNVADNLWPETAEVIRRVRPKYVFLENVPAAFGEPVPVLSADELGAPHGRPRGWIVADTYPDSESRRAIYEEVAGTQALPECAWWGEDVARAVGVDDGVAYRMDRLKALGNGQVPIVAATAWRLLA